MGKIKTYLRGAAATAVLGIASGFSAYAQDAGSFMSQAESAFGQVKTSMFTIVKIALVIAGLVTLVMAIINVAKGEREAAGKLVWWIIGIAFGFGAVTILQGIS